MNLNFLFCTFSLHQLWLFNTNIFLLKPHSLITLTSTPNCLWSSCQPEQARSQQESTSNRYKVATWTIKLRSIHAWMQNPINQTTRILPPKVPIWFALIDPRGFLKEFSSFFFWHPLMYVIASFLMQALLFGTEPNFTRDAQIRDILEVDILSCHQTTMWTTLL